MSISIYDHSIHLRGGRFGHAQQHFERKFNDYIDDIRLMAEGFHTPIAEFTKKRSGIIDSENLEKTVDEILGSYEGFKNDKEKEFYGAFLYCAMALCSLEFVAFEAGVSHVYDIKKEKDKTMDFRYFLENIETHTNEEGTFLDEDCLFAMYLPRLYELLAGKTIELKTVYEDIGATLSEKEWAEIQEDMDIQMEASGSDPMDFYPGDYEEQKYSESEADEANRSSAMKLKAVYPAYETYIKKLERFAELTEECLGPGFRRNVKTMISDFLAESGRTIYNNEDAFVELMVSLTRVRKTVKRVMTKGGKD